MTTVGANKDLKELRVTMKQLTDYVTAQAATLAALYTKTNSGDGRGGQNTDKKKCGQAYTCAPNVRWEYIIRRATT